MYLLSFEVNRSELSQNITNANLTARLEDEDLSESLKEEIIDAVKEQSEGMSVNPIVSHRLIF